MTRFIMIQKKIPVKDCIHCPYYDQTLSSNTMEKLYLCTHKSNPKITHSLADTYYWFNEYCTFEITM